MIKGLGQFALATVIISILGFGFWLAYEPWLEVSKTFESKFSLPEIFSRQI